MGFAGGFGSAGGAGAPGLGVGVNSFWTFSVPSAARTISFIGFLSSTLLTRAWVGQPKSIPLISIRSRRSGGSLASGPVTARLVAQLLPRESAVSLPLTIRTRF